MTNDTDRLEGESVRCIQCGAELVALRRVRDTAEHLVNRLYRDRGQVAYSSASPTSEEAALRSALGQHYQLGNTEGATSNAGRDLYEAAKGVLVMNQGEEWPTLPDDVMTVEDTNLRNAIKAYEESGGKDG